MLAALAGLLLAGTLAACGTASAPPATHAGSVAKATSKTATPHAHGSDTSGKASSSSTGSSSGSSTGGSSGSGSSSGATGTTLARCTSDNLAVALVQEQAAAGSRIRIYSFTNQASASCTLYGYPGFQLLGQSDQPIATHVTWTPGPKRVIVLPPGGHAWFTMQYPAATGYGSLTCPTSSQLEVTPPNAYHSITVAGRGGTIRAYGGTTENLQCGSISVDPVTSVPPES
jgi:hypothetical protein